MTPADASDWDGTGSGDGAVSCFAPPLWSAPPRPSQRSKPAPPQPAAPPAAPKPAAPAQVGPPWVGEPPASPPRPTNRLAELFAEEEAAAAGAAIVPNPEPRTEPPVPQVASFPPAPRPLAGDAAEEDEPTDAPPPPPAWLGVTRGVAGVLGAAATAAAFGPARAAGFDGTLWWCDLAPLPGAAAPAALGFGGAGLLAFAAAGSLPGPLRWAATAGVAALAGFAVKTALHDLRTVGLAPTLAGQVAVCFLVVLIAVRLAPRRTAGGPLCGWAGLLAGAAACGVGFPLAAGALPPDRTPLTAAAAVAGWWTAADAGLAAGEDPDGEAVGLRGGGEG